MNGSAIKISNRELFTETVYEPKMTKTDFSIFPKKNSLS